MRKCIEKNRQSNTISSFSETVANGSMKQNALKETRESLLMSKAELARAAEVSPITIARIERGMPCRMETMRKIILALGLDLSDKNKIFKD